jgi:chaperonin GroES
MAFRPLYDRILVKRIDATQTTSGGLFIPESAKEKPMEAEVVSVGKGRRLKGNDAYHPVALEAGQRVLFGKYTGDEVKLDGVEHIILREEDVLAIIEH